ncbi:hypothetical protein Tco_1312479 [Tanacetum coccineum]
MTYFQDHRWYDELVDGKLKEETLELKAKIKGSWGNATFGVMKFCKWLKDSFENFHEIDYNVLEPYGDLAETMICDYDCKIRYHLAKANVATDALSRKERAKPLRIGALVMTINSNLPPQIHEAQVEALKKENVKDENLHGMDKDFETRLDRTLCIRSRNWLSHYRDSRKLIRHGSQKNLTIPPTLGSDKTYHYLKQWY